MGRHQQRLSRRDGRGDQSRPEPSLIADLRIPPVRAGALTVTSSIVDTTSTTSTALNYNNSSDINSLTASASA